jgi:general secretion pathway protein D
VVTPRAAYLDEVRSWIERLDKPGDSGPDAQLFVYQVQNGSAQHLADVLSGIFGGKAAAGGAPSTTGVAPRLSATSATTAASTPFGSGSPVGTPSAASGLQGGGANLVGQSAAATVTSVALDSGVRVVADDLNNSLLIYGTRVDFRRIESALKRLDMPATQVLIEASIIEVALNDSLKYGVQWLFSDSARNGLSGLGNLGGLAQDTSTISATGGFTYSLRNPLGNLRAVLNALDGKTAVNVISSPSLMVLDNHTANITSGTQLPIKTGETVGITGVTTSTFQYKDTGVTLAVTPSVKADDMVTMQILQSVSDIGDEVVGTGGLPRINQRQVTSKVAVRSGETLVLGGLIREKSTAGSKGVPGLHAIPLFGALFGTKEKVAERTELLVVITPRVIRSTIDMREVSDELKERMKGLSGRSMIRGRELP